MLTAAQFRDQVDGYLKRTKTSPSAFGRSVLGDPNFVSDLRKGRVPNLRVVGKVLDAINAPSSQASDDIADHAGGSSPGPTFQIQQSLQPVDASRRGAEEAAAGSGQSSSSSSLSVQRGS